MSGVKDQRYDFASSKRVYEGCSCNENTLRFYYCRCGARAAEMTLMANEIIPDLSLEQVEAMTVLDDAIPQRTSNNLGYGLKKLGLNTNTARSGDNASIMTDLGKLVQKLLRDKIV